jgi:tetratricopeptide (TPR) repeat protein
MRAECSFKNNDVATALISYNKVLEKGDTKYKERCLIQTSLIYYKQKDYQSASQMYLRLENESMNGDVQNNARINLMRCFVFLNSLDSASMYAAKVVTILHLSNDIYGQAHYLLGKSALAKGDKVEAKKQFTDCEKAVPNTEYAAESRYQLCWIQYDNKEYKPASKALLKEINDYAGFSEWSGKGWLLLADDYLALKDTFQAKYVLKNYIENGDVPELQKIAQDKLNVIEAAQQPGNQKKEDDLIIPMGSPSDNKLYDNEPLKQGGGQ